MRPSRTGQSILNSAIAAVLFVITIFIVLPVQALVLPLPSQLPPDPGIVGEATVEGTDINRNGVRDELELAIFARYPDEPRIREFLYHMAIYYQAILRQPTNTTVVLNSFGYLTAYSSCLESLFGGASVEDNMLRPEVLNTYDRSVAYISAMDATATALSVPLKTVNCFTLPAYPDVPPGVPGNISFPAINRTGTFSVYWEAVPGNVTRYELQREVGSNFDGTPGYTIYSGTALMFRVTVPVNETYYFRVRACNNLGCSNYMTGDAGVVVNVAQAETIPPTVSITAPASNSNIQVGSTVTVFATASDNVAIAGVQFTLNGTALGAEDTTAPYGISWNTTGLQEGIVALSAIARDTSRNSTTASPVSVTLQTCPDCTVPAGNVGRVYPDVRLLSGSWMEDMVLAAGSYPPGMYAYRSDHDGIEYQSIKLGGRPTVAGIYTFTIWIRYSKIGGGTVRGYYLPSTKVEIKP